MMRSRFDFATWKHHDASMRTTLSINDALLVELRKRADSTGKPFRAVVEETLQAGLARSGASTRKRRFRVQPHPLELKPGLGSVSLNQLYDQVEAEDSVKSQKPKR
jgi:hypothetical protein